MDATALGTWLDVVAEGFAVLFVLVGGLWAYTKYIVERGVLPPVEPSIECKMLGTQDGSRLVELLLHLENKGTATLVATKISMRVRYLLDSDPVHLEADLSGPLFGRVRFPNSVARDLSRQEVSGVPVLKYDSFVQPNVDQSYSVVSAVPDTATFLLVRGRFEYAQRPTLLQNLIVAVSRRLGLIQYTLSHVSEPHTVERAFSL
jgi:hypothetical protein